MRELLDAVAYDPGFCLFGECQRSYYFSLFVFFQLINMMWTLALGIWRSRRFELGCASVLAVELVWWLLVALANKRVPGHVVWPALLLMVIGWRRFGRPPRLYEPPADPPPFGGPYR